MDDQQSDGAARSNDDPVRVASGRWRITFSKVLPEGAWRQRLLDRAQGTTLGQALRLAFEGSTVEFDCPDSDDSRVLRDNLHARTRAINDLISEVNRRQGLS